MNRWKFVYATLEGKPFREIFRNVGIEADGSLWNPNGYPAELVRAAILAAEERRRAAEERRRAAEERRRARRIAGAVKATATRARRRTARVHEAAKRLVEGQSPGASDALRRLPPSS
jgi:hypothetical protein